MLRPVLSVLVACLTSPLAAVDVPGLVKQVWDDLPADERQDPGNVRFPERLNALLAEDLGWNPAERIEMRLRLAEAWLGADRPQESTALVTALLAEKDLPATARTRAGLALVASCRIAARIREKGAPAPTGAEDSLKAFGEFPPEVQARAAVVDAEILVADNQPQAAFPGFDKALQLLAKAPAPDRVPVYALRVLAMERSGMSHEDISAWLKKHEADEAVAMVLSDLMTASQELVGKPAPPLKAPRLDGEAGSVELASYKGRPVLLYFFATWCKACTGTTPAVVQLAKEAPDNLAVLGISLDSKETSPALAAWRTNHAIVFPVAGERLGWDSELDDAFHVNAIPSLILIDAAGRIAAIDLAEDDAQKTVAKVRSALKAPAKPGAGQDHEVIP